MTLDDYILSHIDPEPEYLHRLWRATHLHLNYPRMASGHLQGRLLHMLVHMIRPRNILEIGTYSGYSTLCMASALQPGALIHTIEINDEQEDFTRPWLENSPWAEHIRLYIGDALQLLTSPSFLSQLSSPSTQLSSPSTQASPFTTPASISTSPNSPFTTSTSTATSPTSIAIAPTLPATSPASSPTASASSSTSPASIPTAPASPPNGGDVRRTERVFPSPSPGFFSLIFIDADKRHYVDYYLASLPLLSPGGFILADNTLWSGQVLDDQVPTGHSGKDAQTQGILAFNDLVACDPSVERILLPIRDGLTIIRKKEEGRV